MKIIFFGLGSIGLRHAAILKKGGQHDLYAFRTFKGQRKNDLKIKEVTSWREVDHVKPDIAFITNPTSLHVKTALACAKRGMHLFIEKPVDSSVNQLNQLKGVVQKKRLSTYVAYVLRFHPVIKAIKKNIEKNIFLHMRIQATSYLHRWRPGSDPLKSYSAKKSMGGGVIYELSHEMDYVQYLLGGIKKVRGQFAKRSNLTVDAEDYADILVQTQKGPVSIHINFMSQIDQRIIQVDFKEKSLVGDMINSTLTEYKNGKLIKKTTFKQKTKDCYAPQIQFFMRNLRNRKMMNNLDEASELFKKIYNFKTRGV